MRMVRPVWFSALCLVVASCAAQPAPSNTMVEMFNWWNQAFETQGAYTPEAFSKYYTDDAVMIIDGSARANGLKELSRNFNRIQGSVESVEIVMPPIESFQQGNRIFTYHKELVRDGGQDSVGYVMGYVVIDGGKISKINFVNMDEAAAQALHAREISTATNKK